MGKLDVPSGKIMLEVDALNLHFGGVTALKDVSIAVPRGHIVGVIGPNGAGKTSLLNCANGFYRPNSGRILLDGLDITDMRPSAIANLGVARTFQSVQMIPEATVLENVLVGRHVQQRHRLFASMLYWGPGRRDEIRQREVVESILERLGISGLRKREAGVLPYGQLRLVEVARALATEPRLLFLDEPTSGMNRRERDDIGRVVTTLRETLGLTQIIVEHDVRFIAGLCDIVVVLNFGQVIAIGSPREVLNSPEVIEAYVGRNVLN
jgi:branched-chain amino acid transport system ATP-binding protein